MSAPTGVDPETMPGRAQQSVGPAAGPSVATRRVLCILDDDWSTRTAAMAAAIELAAGSGATLTLAKGCNGGRRVRWLEPFVSAWTGVSGLSVELERCALDVLALSAEMVPEWVMIKTVLLKPDLRWHLLSILGSGAYQDLVVSAVFSRRHPRVIAEIRGIIAGLHLVDAAAS